MKAAELREKYHNMRHKMWSDVDVLIDEVAKYLEHQEWENGATEISPGIWRANKSHSIFLQDPPLLANEDPK